VQKLPALDGVVHCAGIWRVKLAKNLTEQDINEIMSINFNATVILQSELMAQKKISKGSSVVIMSSKAAEVPSIASSLYSATKSALQSYGKCLALELAPRNIRVNCICPARVWTPLVYSTDIEEEDLKEREKKYPLKRFGNPDDIANLAVFLLSEASSWITGSCIDITGGALEL
jgi:NAD(P)-dependent dehydrogenase (short-subunit alcohol dehydrogenase family)